MPGDYPLPSSDPASLGFAAQAARSSRSADQAAHRGRPLSRRADRAGAARPAGAVPHLWQCQDRSRRRCRPPTTTLFLLFSQTKVLTSSAVWTLVEEGKLSFMDKIADHLPEFAARGKADITLHQVMTHQGGFPSNDVTKATWTDHARMRAEVCDFSLDWTPGIAAAIPRPAPRIWCRRW